VSSQLGPLMVKPIHRPNAAIAIHRLSDTHPTTRARMGVTAGVCHASAPLVQEQVIDSHVDTGKRNQCNLDLKI